ncbi:carboxylesterase/lipase family protein [Streptomyces sp. DH24]|uniref:carboxylesterase/lipase family protein n=1 Tax=Streptomyces sp. DH24 TaxID=3040123 RepID=UPI00244290E8|nr:carboxylesterase family protein [Streptomyces sp. DH24]MDG9715625.1 carboxylesterase family protein [Streptomyces sp. DH24]
MTLRTPPSGPAYPVVRTAHGPVRGERRTSGVRFLGVPYARPPVGPLRFAAPVPPEPWTRVRDATAYGPTAQRRAFAEVTTIPEPTVPGPDILNLNVFTPDPSPGAGLPVLVWIHGGGFVAGSAASPWYDGAAFNREGVVVVSVGYRLGVEGFLSLPDAPDNRGVRDWIAALEWVRDNITAFGGDPAKVTVAGQSAGGGAVLTLLATPSAQGLFRAGISASGAVMRPQGRDVADAVRRLFTARTGVPATAAALQDLTDARLLAHQDRLNAPGPERTALPMLALAPFADGELVPEPVPDALVAGDAGADVPLLLGCTAHEFNGIPQPDTTPEDVRVMLTAHGLDEAHIRRFLDSCDGGPGDLLNQAVTDTTFRFPAVAVAEARARRERPTWLYEFRWPSTAPAFAGLAHHCTDLPFAFDLLGAEGVTAVLGTRPPQHLADAVHGAWVAFVRDLDPGPDWPRHTTRDRSTRIWDSTPRSESDPLGALREIWSPLLSDPTSILEN